MKRSPDEKDVKEYMEAKLMLSTLTEAFLDQKG